ncbi:MAG: hypothetical protein ABII00_13790 [Elusimicrobiota bacterium]
MTDVPDQLAGQIEAAYDYRGHVTITLAGGERLEGFVYNRVQAHPKPPDGGFIEVFLKDSDASRRLRISEIRSIELTGKDHAESYEQFLDRTGK